MRIKNILLLIAVKFNSIFKSKKPIDSEIAVINTLMVYVLKRKNVYFEVLNIDVKKNTVTIWEICSNNEFTIDIKLFQYLFKGLPTFVSNNNIKQTSIN